jgi:hypothetical protein
LTAFLDFVDYTQTTQAIFTTPKERMGIITDQFTEYRTSSQYTARQTSNATPHTGPVHTRGSSLDNWKKGVKRDMTLYPSLKHDHQFDTWNRETKAVVDTQGLSNVLNSKYAPTAMDGIALFKEQKIFMFAVFNKILLTDQGKKIVRAQEVDSNAQAIYEELRDYLLESTRSSLDTSKLLIHITSSLLYRLFNLRRNSLKSKTERNSHTHSIVPCSNRLQLHTTTHTRISHAPTAKFTPMTSSLT